MADQSVLESAVYARAFEQVMRGVDPALLTDDERQALVEARAAAGMAGPGYPMPAQLDPTRNRTGLHVHDHVPVSEAATVRQVAVADEHAGPTLEGGADGA